MPYWINVTNIAWDVDDKEDLKLLPSSVTMLYPANAGDDYVTDWLSDHYGFCVKGCAVERRNK